MGACPGLDACPERYGIYMYFNLNMGHYIHHTELHTCTVVAHLHT